MSMTEIDFKPIPILFREELKEYDFGPGHPIHGDRFELFPKFLRENLNKDDYQIIESDFATEEDLLLICKKDYIDFTKEFFKDANLGSSYRFHLFHSADNVPRGKTGKVEMAARLIIGQAKLAADLIQENRFQKIVSIGGGLHHAKPSYGEGFCIYNDVAFTATYLIKKYGLKRILILDTDAHAGNGTSDYFFHDRRVLQIDLHQDPRTIYPGTGFADEIGKKEGKGYTVNIPMPVNAGDDSYEFVFDEIVKPITDEFRPQILIRNGGADPCFYDELTSLGLSINGLRMIGDQTREISKICGGKVIDLILSGYNKKFLHYGWLALICGLADIKIKIEETDSLKNSIKDSAFQQTKKVVEEVKENLKDYWKFG